MKKIYFYMMIAAVVLTTACNKNGDEPIIEPGPNQMIMTTQQSNVIIIMAGSGTVTIDWGDKMEIETYPLLDFNDFGWQNYNHIFSGSSIHTITITGNNITRFACLSTGTTQMDFSRNPELTVMSCGDNLLKSLDVSSNTKLMALDCFGNFLTNLDVSKNTELGYLNFRNNQLTKLDVSTNSNLMTLHCRDNLLTAEALNAMFETLHDIMFPGRTKIIYIGANPGTNDCNRSIAENKGWIVYD